MITAAEFLKWLEVFRVQYGPNVITVPVSMAQGGTGAALTASNGSLFYSTAAHGALLPTANNGILVTSNTGIPSISTTLPAGLTIPGYLALAGGTMTGAINMGSHAITSLLNPVNPQDAMTLNYAGATYVPLAGGTMSGPLYLSALPTLDSEAASKQYVDDVAAGLAPTGPVDAASTVNFVATYNNGASGVGAFLLATSTGVFLLDGVTPTVGQDYLFKNQTDTTQNGIYNCDIAGAIGVAAKFTRSNHYDTPSAINNTGIVPITNGDTQAGQGWYETNTITTIGTDPITFVRFGSTGTVTSITAGTGLTGGTITGSGTIALDIPVIVSSGGTGLTALTAHNLIIGNGTSAPNLLAPSATSGLPLISQGASADPAYGVAVVAGGGTGLATTTAYGLIAGGTTATGNFQNVGVGALGTILQGGGAGALPAFSTATYPLTSTANQLLYSSANNVIAGLTSGNNGVLVTGVSGIPSISTTLPTGLTIPGYAHSGANGDITSMTGLTGVIQAPSYIGDASGNSVLSFVYIANPVNHISIQNNSAGNFPVIFASGSDAAVAMGLVSKGGAFNLYDSLLTTAGTMYFRNANGAGGNYTALKVADAAATSLTLVLPSADGTANFPLVTSGAGVLSFGTIPVAAITSSAWTTATATVTGFSSTTIANMRYQKTGRVVNLSFEISGTSNATTFTITNLPYALASPITATYANAIVQNNGGNLQTGLLQFSSASTTVNVFATVASGAFANSGTKALYGFYSYESNT